MEFHGNEYEDSTLLITKIAVFCDYGNLPHDAKLRGQDILNEVLIWQRR